MEQDYPPLTNSNTKNPKVYQKKGQEIFVKSILTNTKYKKKEVCCGNKGSLVCSDWIKVNIFQRVYMNWGPVFNVI